MQTQTSQSKILTAAINAFGQYGYKKTTMQDIADEAGLSRPAVYQYYKNKAAVFSALLTFVLGQAKQAAKEHFDMEKSAYLRIYEGMLAFETVALKPTLTTAKGHELLSLASTMEEEIVTAHANWLLESVAAILQEAQNNGEISLTHLSGNLQQVAEIMIAGVTGVKHSVKNIEQLESHTELLFQLFWKGLSA